MEQCAKGLLHRVTWLRLVGATQPYNVADDVMAALGRSWTPDLSASTRPDRVDSRKRCSGWLAYHDMHSAMHNGMEGTWILSMRHLRVTREGLSHLPQDLTHLLLE
jgi:hypothetical protein